MKKINIYLSVFVTIFLLGACNESVDLVTEDALEGGLMEVTSSSNSYVVGNSGPYTIEYYLKQGADVKIQSIDLYKTFYGSDIFTDSNGKDSIVGYQSNEILDQTVTVGNTDSHFITIDYMFEDFREGLTAKDSELPTTDVNFNIGDRFSLRTVAHLSDGREIEQSYTISFTVSTRYAGQYKAITGAYYRIGVPTGGTNDWPAVTVIESVNSTTYKVVEYLGLFNGNEWYFEINDGVITYPDETPSGDAQTGNGQPFITCETNPADYAAVGVPCDGTSNIVIDDDEGGKDRLVMSYGYFTPGSGPRIFYHVLEKIVD